MSDAPLDRATIDRLQRELGGDPVRVQAILSVYLEEVGPYRADLRAAVERGDAYHVIFGAHRLGSASVLVGANHLTALCRELESLNHDALAPHGRELAARIEQESATVVQAVAALLHDQPAAR